MISNEQETLQRLIESRRQQNAPNEKPDDYFETYVAELVLREYIFSEPDLETGDVSGSGDGGIDRIYPFINGHLITEESTLATVQDNPKFELHIVQATRSKGFDEDHLHQLEQTLSDLLDFSRDLANFRGRYNGPLLEIATNFRKLYSAASLQLPSLHIHVYYASLGNDVHPNVQFAVDKLKSTVPRDSKATHIDVTFLTVGRLLELEYAPRERSATLRAGGNVLTAGDDGYICLVELREFYNFITLNGELKEGIFESNVRDYQPGAEVNREIAETLNRYGDEDFWWLNNGITVLGSDAGAHGFQLNVKQPQIVNGLQTSMEIYRYFRDRTDRSDKRKVLVRVIITANESNRDKIIRATNHQTRVQDAFLHATEKIHRNIENHFRPSDLFYDRRKNYYRNRDVPRVKIIDIRTLGQAVMAILLGMTDVARARPGDVLNDNDLYPKVFSETYPLSMYLKCAQLVRSVDAFLRGDDRAGTSMRNNVKFHMARFAAVVFTGDADIKPSTLGALNVEEMSDSFLGNCWTQVLEAFERVTEELALPPDRVAKSVQFKDEVERRAQKMLRGT